MKYKILLAGKNKSVIDDFFNVMSDEFDCITTSNRSGDIANHMEYFQPDVFVYCFANETNDDIMKLGAALETLDKKYREVILIGNVELCNEFMRLKPEFAKLILYRPIVGSKIKKEILDYLSEHVQRDFNVSVREIKEEAVVEKVEQVKQQTVEVQETSESKVKQEDSTEDIVQDEQKHILIIDDDPMMLRLIKTELKEHYNVATAVSGKIGLKFLGRKKTDLILLDYEMPEEDGVAVLEKLRANPETKDIPVVFLTGINDVEKIRKVVAMKPQGYLLKPIECKQLLETIQKIIG